MALRQAWTRILWTRILLTPLLLGGHLLTRPAIAQVTPRSMTGQLNQNSQTLKDGSYFDAQQQGQYTLSWQPTEIVGESPRGGDTVANGVTPVFSNAECSLHNKAIRPASKISQKGVTGDEIAQITPESIRADQLSRQVAELANARCYAEAIPLAEEALSLYRDYLGPTHPFIALKLATLAGLHTSIFDDDKAESLLLQAIEIYRQQPDIAARYRRNLDRSASGGNSHGIADSLNSLAFLYRTQGRYGEAEALILEVSEIHQSDPNYPEQVTEPTRLAFIYQSQGRYDEAEALLLKDLEEALASDGYHFREELNLSVMERLAYTLELGTSEPAIAASLDALGTLYYFQGRYSEAESFLTSSLEVLDRVVPFGNDMVSLNDVTAITLANLGSVYSAQNRYGEAESRLIQALQRFSEPELGYFYAPADTVQGLQELDWANHSFNFATNVALIFDELATIYYVQKRYSEAESIQHKVLEFYREQLDTRHPSVATSFNQLALLQQAQNNPSQALEYLQQGIAIEEYHLGLNLAGLAEDQSLNYTAQIIKSTDQVLSFNLQATPDNQAAKQLALSTLLQRKGRVLDVATERLQRLKQTLDPESQRQLDELIATRKQLAELLFSPPAVFSPDAYRARVDELSATEKRLDSLLARRSNLFRTESQPITLETIQSTLSQNSVLLEFVRYRPLNPAGAENRFNSPRYAAYLLFPNGRIEAIDLGDAAEIETAVQAFTQLLQNTNASLQRATIIPTATPEAIDGVTQLVSDLILAPIAPHIQGIDHLLISPDGQLNRLPFEALQPVAGGDYLVQRYQISYLNSGRDLLKFNVTEPSSNPVVIMANPDYETANDHGAEIAQVAGNSQTATSNHRNTGRSVELSQLQVGPLPGTAAEADSISSLLPDAQVFTTVNATENTLKQVQAPQILHIATHGFFLPGVDYPERQPQPLGLVASSNTVAASSRIAENPLLRSGLALAGFNPRRSGSEDGVFTALEASQLNLFGTQLVVLSACETGLGEITSGEGVYGLRRAFALAGAETQLMSLWQVSDYGTQSLMARYYEKLTAGQGRSEALRNVQLEMIKSGGQYSHPYYWAAFILTGQWSTLNGPL